MITVRRALPDDAVEILNVHFAAVHGSPVDYYDPDLLDDWSPPVDLARISSYVERFQKGEEETLVAEMDGKIVAFGAYVIKANELRAFYVHPRVSGQGVGRELMKNLEAEAAFAGLGWLTLNSSLNAETFYLAQGFESDGLGKYVLPTGREMTCVRMYKFLTR